MWLLRSLSQSEVSVGSDEIDNGKQAREDALDALIKSNSMPGFEHIAIDGMTEIRALWDRAASLGSDDIFVFQVEREVVERGPEMATGSAWILTNMPANVHGRVMLSFRGWADDPRELFEIPEVVAFCRVLLLGSLASPSKFHARAVLKVLVDEALLAQHIGEKAHDAAGQYWLISVAFHEEVMARSKKASTGIFRDVKMNVKIRKWLLGNGPAPTE